ncbi:uncharacterized protein METZ01_LOCUS373240 [marine metagenome]|uniref:Outer membrane protein beta-barrel domain-containing protein n=1 Tax=marine metagenome TaxID=408172 RepID=A0A382TEC2_9ZZZZ
MNKSIKYLAVLLIILMPIAAYAEMWSPNRVRFNYRIGGSVDDGALAPGTMKGKSGGVHLMNAGYKDTETERVNGGMSIHYIMEMGMIVGIHLYSTEYVTKISQTSDWEGTPETGATGAGAALQYNTLYGGAGTALGTRKNSSSINFLDLGYFYDMKDIVAGMSISGGIGLPVLGSSSSVDIAYGTTGHALNGGLYTESVTDFEGTASSFFVDFGYAFGIHEGLFGLRNISSSGSATVSEEKGVGKVLGKDKFESSGSSMSYFIGYGFIF